MKTSASLAALVLAAIPGLVSAHDIAGGLTLGFGHGDISDVSEDITTRTLDGRINVATGSGLTFGARFDAVNGEIDGVAGDVNGTVLGATAGYRFGSGFDLGIYAERMELSIDGLPLDPSATSIGLTAGYELSGMRIDGFFGRTDISPDLPGVDIDDFGVAVTYDATDRLVAGANIMRTRVSMGPDDLDLDMIGIAGAYAFNERWTAFGGASRTSVDLLDADFTTFGVGVSYNLSSLLNFASLASVEFARTDADIMGTDIGSIDTFRFGFTIPLNGKTQGGNRKVPLNSVADAVLNPTHSVLSSTVLAAF